MGIIPIGKGPALHAVFAEFDSPDLHHIFGVSRSAPEQSRRAHPLPDPA